MENYITAIILVLILIFAFLWRISPRKEDLSKNLKKSKLELDNKELNLKQIYASMAEYDRLIKERDDAYLAGDKELYHAKIREASECYKRSIKLFED